MSSSKIVLVTGANRGIGRALAEAFSQQEGTIVLACVRDPENISSRSLADFKPAVGSSIHLIKLDVTTQAHYDALPQVFTALGVRSLDVVVANAGIFDTFTTVAETDPEDLKKHFEVNTVGPMLLFQATGELLKIGNGKFVAISAASSSIADMEHIPIPATSHGASKAALNYIVRKIHFENEGIVSFAMDPGQVQTDLLIAGAKKLGAQIEGSPPDKSAQAMLRIIGGASRDTTSGTFMQYNGKQWRW